MIGRLHGLIYLFSLSLGWIALFMYLPRYVSFSNANGHTNETGSTSLN